MGPGVAGLLMIMMEILTSVRMTREQDDTWGGRQFPGIFSHRGESAALAEDLSGEEQARTDDEEAEEYPAGRALESHSSRGGRGYGR